MKCPKCSSSITAKPDASGIVSCPGCGAKLRSKSAAAKSPTTGATRAEPPTGSSTMPIPPGMAAAAVGSGAVPAASLEAILAEIRAVRRVQDEILGMLRSRPTGSDTARTGRTDDADDAFPPAAPSPIEPVRGGRRRVLLIDDDAKTTQAASQALAAQQFAVRTVSDGTSALQVIGAQKPDLIVLELDLQGEMPGRDLINLVKATMEWVDIPILLYTRHAVKDEEEARTVHGADAFVLKGPNAPAALAQRVAAMLQRG